MIQSPFLLADQTLFKNIDAFEFDYIPDQVIFREEQISELAFRVRPGVFGARPASAICRGPPGTGKTTTVKHLLAEIAESQKRLVPVYVNCQTDHTRYAVFSRIYRRVVGHAPPRTGVAATVLADAIAASIIKQKIVVLVCLDDFQYLLSEDTANAVLYSLLRMYLNHSDCRVGVILTTSEMDLDVSRVLESGVASSLCADDISFPRYTPDEIREILRIRVREAVWPGVISSEVLDLIVWKTHKAGDLRVGLDLLKRAVLMAERNARSSVVREDILLAYGDARLITLKKMIRVLPPGERALLDLIADSGGGDPLTSGELYNRLTDDEEISYTTFYERLKRLAEYGLVNLRIRQKKGRTSVITPRYEAEEIQAVSR
ncbi:hypothetical protein RJ53_09360 [Methanocalculus chunghsingensis]|uniref:ORC1-type DNA replication protein n=1 Tax=Methanocalculus chunghsingensis TaxID=156457 RepID=A0A8J8B4S2_9EURY|nr:ORC1-type DNA replication protein [Methanocalculus chunghsingensis]MBR1369670.1 hypothetical protein [Methanocalculus chunghsingensis]